MNGKPTSTNGSRKLARLGTKRKINLRKPAPSPRAVEDGDIAPVITKDGIAQHHIAEAVDAAQLAKITAVQDIVAQADPAKVAELAQSLSDILHGASPDDADVLRRALRKQPLRDTVRSRVHPDEMLSADWREGNYPYKNLMSRKNYEKQKYQLQVVPAR